VTVKKWLPFGNDMHSEPPEPEPELEQGRHVRGSATAAPAAGTPVTQDERAAPETLEAASANRWAPVVVDKPIFDFEPKPPLAHAYRPDTIFDGWSTGYFTVRLASVRGYSHRYSGTPRQDDAIVAFHPETGAVTFAVADGVSSAPQSHIGATTACQVAAEVVLWQLASGRSGPDWAQVVDEVVRALDAKARHLLKQDRLEPAAVEELLATTLVAGCATPTDQGPFVSMIQIGDSGAWVLHRGRYHPVLEQKNDPRAQIISSAVSPLPRIPAPVTPIESGLRQDSVLLIGTDGFGDPLGDGGGKVGQLFAEHLASPPAARGLAHLLDFSRDTFDDDRTLVALWPRVAGGGAAR
jgi:Protein phosphatase 2C